VVGHPRFLPESHGFLSGTYRSGWSSSAPLGAASGHRASMSGEVPFMSCVLHEGGNPPDDEDSNVRNPHGKSYRCSSKLTITW
jgi:hypothetical protein